MPNLTDLAFKQWLYEEELAFQREVQAYRDYYAGDQLSFLNDRLRDFLNVPGKTLDFQMNVCRAVVNAVTERLGVDGFGVSDERLLEWAAKLWSNNNMAIQSGNAHHAAVRDGESFVIVTYENGRPELKVHNRFVDSQAGGDGDGCKITYPGGDANAAPLFASKRWLDDTSRANSFQRMTVYYPERIEKFEWSGGWTPYRDEGDPGWPIAWKNNDGPLGIPIFHFAQPDARSELSDAVYMQNAVNKILLDMLASADVGAFRILLGHGFPMPTTDGEALAADASNAIKVKPGTYIHTTEAGAGIDSINGEDPTPLVNMLGQLVMWLSVVTDTPISRFQFTGQIAAEGTLKQQEITLLSKVKDRQIRFGGAWNAALDMARKLENTFGAGGLDETIPFAVDWRPADTRSDADQQAEWRIKSEVGVPQAQLWREMGYTDEQIASMLVEREAELAMKQRVAAASSGAQR